MVWGNGKQIQDLLVNFIVLIAQMRKSRESLGLVSMMSLKEWNKNFRLYIPSGKNRNTFSGALLLRDIFHWNNPKTLSCSIYFLSG